MRQVPEEDERRTEEESRESRETELLDKEGGCVLENKCSERGPRKEEKVQQGNRSLYDFTILLLSLSLSYFFKHLFRITQVYFLNRFLKQPNVQVH